MSASRPSRGWPLALLGTLLLGACTLSDRTPEGAVRLFVEAVQSGKSDDLLELLAPESRKQLEALAQLATAQTGGRHLFSPDELLVIGMKPPLHKLGDSWKAEVTSEQGTRAEVRITSADNRHHQTFRLVHAQDRWRIVLPRDALAPLPNPGKSRPSEK